MNKSVLDYFENLESTKKELESEIERVKTWVNSKGFHNGSAVNLIVRKYRNELKDYLKIVRSDLIDYENGNV